MSAWIKVTDKLPEVGVPVVALSQKKGLLVSEVYTPMNFYGDVLGDKRWKHSNSVVAWAPIPSTEEIISDIKENGKGR